MYQCSEYIPDGVSVGVADGGADGVADGVAVGVADGHTFYALNALLWSHYGHIIFTPHRPHGLG